MNKRPQFRFDLVLGRIATGHSSFIGWEILDVKEDDPGTVTVKIRRRADPAYWIPVRKRTVRYVLSNVQFVPISMWQFKPFRMWTINKKKEDK